MLRKQKKTAHTPGPWRAWDKPEVDEVIFRAVVEGQRRLLSGDIIDVPVAYLVREEDADLIAAAPDLLEAAVFATCPGSDCSHNRCAGLHAAIFKATGGKS